MPMALPFNRRKQRSVQASHSSPSTTNNRSRGPTDSSLSPRMAPVVTTPPSNWSSTSSSSMKEIPIKPRTVTPLASTSSLRTSNTPSWEDYDEGVFGSARRRNKDLDTRNKGNLVAPSSNSYEDEEMPMDELLDTTKVTADNSFDTRSLDFSEGIVMPMITNNVGRMATALQTTAMERPDGLSLEERMLWDVIQSTIVSATKRAKADSAASLSIRETELEMKLSESEAQIKQLTQKLRVASTENMNTTSPTSPSSAATVKRINQLEEQLRERESEIKKRDREHDAELRAIQRVLAEMTNEREEETHQLNQTISELSSKVQSLEKEKETLQKGLLPPPLPPQTPPPSSANVASNVSPDDRTKEEIERLKATIRDLEDEKVALKKEADRKTRRISLLERDFKVLKVQLKKAEDGKHEPETDHPNHEVEGLKSEIAKLKESNHKLQVELDAANKERKARRKTHGYMTPPRPDMTSHSDVESVTSSMSAEDVESLQKNLSETTSSLENAKKIITSLENANSSMAMELRAKLKAKDEELAAVQKESAERKRRLDTLATELRDLQKKHDDIERLESQNKAQIVRHKALVGLLEKSVSGLQAASAVHEVSTATGEPDRANVDLISEILNDVMVGIRTSLEVSEQYIDEFDDETTVEFTDVDVSSEVGRQIDAIIKNDRELLAKNLKDELEQKKIAVRRLEEALKKQNDEIRRLRSEQRSTEDQQQLLAEIQSLREQCANNVEVIATKERELSVLRSSLKVDEADGGYISDDASDGEDETDTTMSAAGLNRYGPEQTEALAKLLAAGGSMPDRASELKEELVKARKEKESAMKELQNERDSLANAKLIISSLEKSNKSMMEDLRSRLQDSNLAIATLLEKSMQHERSSNALREELDMLRKEKERLEAQLGRGPPKLLEPPATVFDVRTARVDPSSDEKKDELLITL